MRPKLVTALALLIAPGGAAAQPGLPETVVTATRVATPVERLPASVSVIDRAAIEDGGYTTLPEALASVPGITVVPTGGPGQQSSVFVRGSNSRHVLVLLDGQPINDPSEANGAFNFGDDLLGDIERIEVVRGPASVYYGSAAVGGVINLITRRAPRDRPFALNGELSGGYPRQGQAVLSAGGTLRDGQHLFDYIATAQAFSTQGSNATADRIWPNLGEQDGARLASGSARLGFEPAAGSRIEGYLARRETRIGLDDRPFGGGFDDPNYGGQNTRTIARLSGETKLFQGFWTTGLIAGFNQDRRKFTNDWDPFNAGFARDSYHADSARFEWNNTLRPAFSGSALEGRVSDTAVIFGVQRQDDKVEAANGSSFFRTTTDARAGSTGFYLGAQTRLFALLDLTGGVRLQEDEDFGSNTTWNLGGVFSIPGLPLPVRLRAAAGTSFKAPSLFQRYGTIPGFFRGNPDLKPESGTSWEAGIEVDVPAAAGTSTLAVTYFENRITDLIDFNAAFDTLENRDRAKISGVELAMTVRPARWLEATLGYTWLDARDAATDTPLPRRPPHSGSLTVVVTPVPAVRITPQVIYAGSHREGAFATYLDDSSTLS
ncbi:MAG: TonB-dependent receptor, partial [Acetobacteraceae bacterium]|nr:TonB-dependent receptor [Acetobacteraceae bacterium]